MSLLSLMHHQAERVNLLNLDPARVRVWNGNPRDHRQLTQASTRDLIDSIVSAGGQKVPALVRVIKGDADHDYEVIVGTRRHYAVQWLRSNGYPDVHFLAQVVNMSDEEAFRIADLENRARSDVSDLERAGNYAQALSLYYNNHLTDMATLLGVSKGWLSKMIRAASVPKDIIAAFASPSDIRVKACYTLIQALDDESRRSGIITNAHQIAEEQTQRRNNSEPLIQAREVTRRLLHVPSPPRPTCAQKDEVSWPSSTGTPALSIKAQDRDGLLLRLHARSGASDEELVVMFREALSRMRPAAANAR
jgi:ParB family chromosome partitioning protein